ncbi:CPXCG motif-containing cysteine-rich protein [Endozoicomonas arenosclerae]|uniref:CPXCG motif-containing cysteine-rich protein n=1 Tax=Endozoicomonas arenosclerae TaxID=1633495 RepID=UPI0009A1C7D4|nr:CPXCG motif-containing cysteine-rich protein [Endozoicomonas arenosclerae]
MLHLETRKLNCPNCGEVIELVIDCSIPNQEYVEDCQVCCRPILISVTVDLDNDVLIEATRLED